MSPASSTHAEWAKRLPAQVLFFDIETTGLEIHDRIVSFSAVMLDWSLSSQSKLSTRVMNFVFDPGIRSHRAAESVHGLDDWFLRHQEPFAARAEVINEFVSSADLVVSHNIEFDYFFLLRDLSASGVALPRPQTECTMRMWSIHTRQKYRSRLDSIAHDLGLSRQQVHSSIEDAWLCMAVWLYIRTPLRVGPFPGGEASVVKNILPVPPRPDGPLPRRRMPR